MNQTLKPPRRVTATPMHVTTAWVDSPVGPLRIGATEAGVCLLEFAEAGQRAAEPGAGCHPYLDQVRAELVAYFAGTLREFTVPLDYAGSKFQRRVWQELLRIPYGETRSYEAIACAVGTPDACRAVGTANGRNPIAIVIPCHRVVNKGGKLGGYGGGLWRKQLLLDLEGGR